MFLEFFYISVKINLASVHKNLLLGWRNYCLLTKFGDLTVLVVQINEILPSSGRASDCQWQSRNSPGFDPSILWQSGIWGAADEAVLNKVCTWKKSNKIILFIVQIYTMNTYTYSDEPIFVHKCRDAAEAPGKILLPKTNTLWSYVQPSRKYV